MKICLNEVSKRYRKQWVFKNLSLTFEGNHKYAILGQNGSGKSTLLKCISGLLKPSFGTVEYQGENGQIIKQELRYQYSSICAPSLDLLEDLTLNEFLEFHFSLVPCLEPLNVNKIIDIIGLKHAQHKALADFSSGMLQRVKLAQAIFVDKPILLLDEPCSNLDHKGIEQYQNWIGEFGIKKLIIVASNDPQEYSYCDYKFNVQDYQ